MRLVASTPDSKPVPEAVRGALAAVSPEDLREFVERISVPRPTGTPENLAVRRTIIELVLGDAGRSPRRRGGRGGQRGRGRPPAGQDPDRGALRLDPRLAGGRRQRQRRGRPPRRRPCPRPPRGRLLRRLRRRGARPRGQPGAGRRAGTAPPGAGPRPGDGRLRQPGAGLAAQPQPADPGPVRRRLPRPGRHAPVPDASSITSWPRPTATPSPSRASTCPTCRWR